MTYEITYYAPDHTMGDTSPADAEAFRSWAHEALAAEYPDHTVTVTADQGSGQQIETNDEARREEIAEFTARLWDRCPWDWTETE